MEFLRKIIQQNSNQNSPQCGPISDNNFIVGDDGHATKQEVYNVKNGGGKDRLSEFHSVDNMLYWEWDFYQRHLHKCVGSQSTRQCTGREVVGSQSWFLVRQICKEAYCSCLHQFKLKF